MFLKHLATPMEGFRDPPGGRDPSLKSPALMHDLNERLLFSEKTNRLYFSCGNKTYNLEVFVFFCNLN